ncbi:MAG: restriction endonuclease [Anaerolineae bacterium]|nr:restriction endonuclease [Chloroflexota bacterium]MCK6580504.1 restriction endonuclease [Anaerolineae bacterium]NUQ07141.1 restriction endonuclease [Anaerolineae bacterium]
MPEIVEAQEILAALGMPSAQHNEMAALTLIALCGLKPEDRWSSAERCSLTVTKGIMNFIRDAYGRAYAPNTRETFRRQVLHQFVQGRIADYNPDAPALPTNSPKAHYAITEAALAVVRTYGIAEWSDALEHFKTTQGSLTTLYAASRQAVGVAVTLPDGSALMLSPGEHNQLQAQVIQLFAPQFASGALLLYLGDTTDKDLYIAAQPLIELGIPVTEHDKLPDIILYLSEKKWLYLIEVVTSHGPMTPKRIVELNAMLKDCSAGKIFVTAFPTFVEFRRHMRNIAWETEVWIAEVPEHLIHFNGDRFLGPHP